jgi:hypothetical protein
MSFNPNDNNLSPISRNNYEEYFVLFADNELSDKERLSVEQFLVLHPDLQQELDLFLAAKLPLEQINLEEKESLLAHSMKLNAIDEALLLYIDNELNDKEKTAVEKKLKTDKAYRLQYDALLQTKPEVSEPIVYPYKKELYRHEEKTRFSFYWMRIAAAVIILLGMGVFVFTYQPKPGTTARDIEKPQPAKETPATTPAKTDVTIKVETSGPVEPTVVKVGEPDDVPNVVRNLKKSPQQQKKIEKQIILPPSEATPQIVANNEIKKPEQKNNVVVNKEEIASVNKEKNSPQQTINNNTVTPPPIDSFNNQIASIATAETRDVVKTGNEKKSSLKGFLRKATRFIERRTNISTTNENDELLIGIVAVKL